MKNMYDLVVYIGRFQPFHLGQQHVLDQAFKQGKQVLILLGSSDSARSPKNPWNALEREDMIRGSISDEECKRLKIVGVPDSIYDNRIWLKNVQEIVDTIAKGGSIALIGFSKDHSSWYLQKFPKWSIIKASPKVCTSSGKTMDATKIRELYFEGHLNYLPSVLSQYTYSMLQEFTQYAELKAWYDFVKEYKFKAENKAPEYALQYMTTDAVIRHGSHILLIKRGDNPGRGLWALPGGFVEEHEWVLDSCTREVFEETGLTLDKKYLMKEKLFDAPTRSTRGRTFSQGYYFDLPACSSPPYVQGKDDAVQAKWFTLDKVYRMRDKLYEDHYEIILTLI